jgi:hypothetical protein
MFFILGVVVLIIIIIIAIFTAPNVNGGKELYSECAIVPFQRVLSWDMKKIPYRRRTNEYKFPIHIGQRKLMLSEIEFLTHNGPTAKTVVYAGAADGTHQILMSRLFPDFEFHLYDPAQFNKKLAEIKNIHIHNEYFTDKICKEWKDKKILFISDIRRTPILKFGTTEYDVEMEKWVAEDMKMQMDWVKIMNPEYSMLKFRLPYKEGQTEYLNGVLYFQIWPGATSTETRLWVPKNPSLIMYDNGDYQDILFAHNYCTRMQHFDIPAIKGEEILKFKGFEFDYDSKAEVHVLCEYLKYSSKPVTLENLLHLFEEENKITASPLLDAHGLLPLEKNSPKKWAKLEKLYPMAKLVKSHNKRVLAKNRRKNK